MDRQTPFERAIARIETTAELEPHRATILYDWPESDEFYLWAATCDLPELLDWAERVERQAATPRWELQLFAGPGWGAGETRREESPRGGRHAA